MPKALVYNGNTNELDIILKCFDPINDHKWLYQKITTKNVHPRHCYTNFLKSELSAATRIDENNNDKGDEFCYGCSCLDSLCLKSSPFWRHKSTILSKPT